MNATEMSEVVDKLADKIGVVAEKIAPIAEEVVRQYELRYWVYTGLCAIVALLGAALITLSFVSITKTQEDKVLDSAGIGAVLGFVVCVVSLAVGSIQLATALSPLPSILGL